MKMKATLVITLAILLLFSACGKPDASGAPSSAASGPVSAAPPNASGAVSTADSSVPVSGPGIFTLSSPAVVDGVLADTYGAFGTQKTDGVPTLSPELNFEHAPEGTVCYALIMDDPDSVPVAGYVWDHWLLANYPAAQLPEDASLARAGEMVQGVNSFGSVGYGGPTPPDAPHTYVLTAYALSEPLALDNGFTRDELEAALAGKVLATAELLAEYSN